MGLQPPPWSRRRRWPSLSGRKGWPRRDAETRPPGDLRAVEGRWRGLVRISASRDSGEWMLEVKWAGSAARSITHDGWLCFAKGVATCRRRPPRQPPWLPERRGVAATGRGGCQACTRRRHARLREPRLEQLEDDYDVALEGDHHRQDVERSKRTHSPSTPARRRCASRAALPPRPSHRSAPRRKLTSSSCCARVSSVLRVVGLAVVSVVAGRASGTLRVRITTSRGARRLAIVAAASQPGGCRGVKIGSQGGCRGPATWLPGRPGVAARVAAASQSPLCICAGYQIWGRNLTRTDQTGVQPPIGAPGRGAQRPGRLPGGQQPPKPEKVTTYGAPVPSAAITNFIYFFICTSKFE